MVTYDYECRNKECAVTWEAQQKITEDAIKICPTCKQETAKRLISKSNFILNGGGWAKSGYSSSK